MYNCQFVESIITVIDSSRHGLKYDIAHVEYLFSTNTPIPQDESFFVPGIELMPDNILQILKLGNFEFVPIPKSEVVNSLNNYLQEVQENKKDETLADSMIGISTSYMNIIKANPLASNFYRLSYDYAIYPENDNSFIIYAKLPIKGFTLPAGGQTRFITILPVNAKYDPTATKGVALNNPDIQEQATNIANGRTVLSFFYQNDPDFTVKYKY
jgi:hypothetical protein